MNAYFGIKTNEKGTFLIIKPPIDGGEIIRNQELNEYLSSHGIEIDFKAVSSAILKSRDEKVVVKLSDTVFPAFDEEMNVYISDDRMHAYVRFIPPSTGGKKLSKEDIQELLKKGKILQGINDFLLDQLANKKKYCTDYEIATGKLPTAGRDATIKYHFDTDNSIRPTLKEDGSVDFFHLNMIHHCQKGDLLAEIIPKEKGENGYDVIGNILMAREVSDISFKYGLNISVSDDGMRLISGVCGHVMLIDNTVFAADVYEIEDVGTATGNIEYNGNIQINGNVEDNYSVSASGTIEIRGTVGAAKIEAGGDIIIANGMYGQGKGSLKANGNIIVKFLESANVEAGGFVEAESILHSNVFSGTDVNVEAKKGYITGGKICATSSVKAKVIGSVMGSDTTIEVGVDGKVKAQFLELQKSLSDNKKAKKKSQTILDSMLKKKAEGCSLNSMQLKYIEQLDETIKVYQKAIDSQKAELKILGDKLTGADGSHIDIMNTLYGGTKITVSGVSNVIKDTIKRCRLVRDGAEIKMVNL